MITRVVMPKFTKQMTQGKILSWKLDEGEAVTSGDVIADIETDTAIMELEATGSGFFRHIVTPEGQTVKAGATLAIIGDLDDATEPVLKEAIRLQKLIKVNQGTSRSARSSPLSSPSRKADLGELKKDRIADTAASLVQAKKFSEELLHRSTEMETKDRKVEEALHVVDEVLSDVSSAVQEFAETPMPDSWANQEHAPQYTLTTEVSLAEGERLREQMIEIQQITLSITTLYVRAVALAFSQHPAVLESFLGQCGTIDVGVGMIVEDHLFTPTLCNCGKKNIAELANDIQELRDHIYSQRRNTTEDSPASFSILDFGMYPIEQVTPILSASQAAVLAIGANRKVYIKQDDATMLELRIKMSLSCREACIDEKEASEFLRTIKQTLERPLAIFLPNRVE